MNLLEINSQFSENYTVLQWWAEFRDNFAEEKDWLYWKSLLLFLQSWKRNFVPSYVSLPLFKKVLGSLWIIFSLGNKSTNKPQFTRCSSWSHLLKMPPAKLFDNHRQIVPVGLQKEWSSSQHNQLSSKSKYQITNRKIHSFSIKNNTLKEFYDKWNFIYGS